MKIGYARVSTNDQNLDLQLAALQEAGCGRIFQEKISGAKIDRPELERLLDQLRPDDIVVVWKLDRLARSTRRIFNGFIDWILCCCHSLHALKSQIKCL